VETNRRTHSHLAHTLALVTLAALFWAGTPVSGQSMPSQDNDIRTGQLATMDRFLDSHPEIAEQLQKDPSLINNQQFIEKHPGLQEFLQNHPGIREEFTENPAAFMRQEQRFERREEGGMRFGTDTTRAELANMDRFLDSHPEIAEQLQKDPSLINNQQFIANHPGLQEFLQAHPGVREEFTENPKAFMRQEERFDRREEAGNMRFGDGDTTRAELANMDRFLDSHPEIAEQLQKDPSLIKNRQFVTKHPELQEFLQSHPGVREEFTENPNAFMRQERRFDRHEDFDAREVRDRDTGQGEMMSFGRFLSGHSSLGQQLSKDPSLVKNKEWLESHPELGDFLKSHPGAKAELMKNPQAFMNSVQQAGNNTATANPVLQPKHKQ
jgi:phage-related protein